jgi:Uma2 family endonuclease
VSTLPRNLLTPEQYLEIERAAEFKSEYYAGEMFAMAGATQAHNLIAGNAFAELRQRFRARPCQTYSNDMRVRVNPKLYTYPDVVAVCGEPRFLDATRDTLLNPVLIIEALARSTEAYDRCRKFDNYKTIDSLRDYLLIATDRIHADLYTRQTDGRWILTSADQIEDSLTLESVEVRLAMADLYEKVDIPGEDGMSAYGL